MDFERLNKDLEYLSDDLNHSFSGSDEGFGEGRYEGPTLAQMDQAAFAAAVGELRGDTGSVKKNGRKSTPLKRKTKKDEKENIRPATSAAVPSIRPPVLEGLKTKGLKKSSMSSACSVVSARSQLSARSTTSIKSSASTVMTARSKVTGETPRTRKTMKEIERDRESIEEDLLLTKRRAKDLETTLMHAKTKLQRYEVEMQKKDREIEQALKGIGANTSSDVRNLKKKFRELELVVLEKDDEISRLKTNSLHTHISELQTERDTYLKECRRLQKQIQDQGMDTNMLEQSRRDAVKKAALAQEEASKTSSEMKSLIRDNNKLVKEVKNLQKMVVKLTEEKEKLSRGPPTVHVPTQPMTIEVSSKPKKASEPGPEELRNTIRKLQKNLEESERRQEDYKADRDKFQELYLEEQNSVASLQQAMRQQSEAKQYSQPSPPSEQDLRPVTPADSVQMGSPRAGASSATRSIEDASERVSVRRTVGRRGRPQQRPTWEDGGEDDASHEDAAKKIQRFYRSRSGEKSREGGAREESLSPGKTSIKFSLDLANVEDRQIAVSLKRRLVEEDERWTHCKLDEKRFTVPAGMWKLPATGVLSMNVITCNPDHLPGWDPYSTRNMGGTRP